jgi:hypothetical protein
MVGTALFHATTTREDERKGGRGEGQLPTKGPYSARRESCLVTVIEFEVVTAGRRGRRTRKESVGGDQSRRERERTNNVCDKKPGNETNKNNNKERERERQE